MDLTKFIRNIPDFPKPGIQFKDVTPLLADAKAFDYTVSKLLDPYRDAKIDAIVGIESRGFIFGAAAARELGVGFVPVRKPGKLPYKSRRVEYALEYGSGSLEIHQDGIQKGARVLIIDDLLATGGTAEAAQKLVEELGGEVVALAFVIELTFLNGRRRFKKNNLHTLLTF